MGKKGKSLPNILKTKNVEKLSNMGLNVIGFFFNELVQLIAERNIFTKFEETL